MPPTVEASGIFAIELDLNLNPKQTKKKKITFLDNDQVQDTEVAVDDAPAHRFALALAGPAGAVAGVALAEQQAHAAVGQDALLHGKALLVVAPADAHHVALEQRERRRL